MSGIELKNINNTFQVTNETRVLAFLRKGILSTVAYSSASAARVVKIPLNASEECLCFNCDYSASFLFYDGTNAVISVNTPTEDPVSVSYWIFGRPSTSSTSGVQVFDGNGMQQNNLLYDSSWIPLKPVGTLNSSFNIPIGKNYAVLPITFKSRMFKIYSEVLNPSGNTDVIYVLQRNDEGVKVSAGSLVVEEFLSMYEQKITFTASLGGRTYDFNYDNNASTNYLVVDVTGL